jgi:hypothetical protein
MTRLVLALLALTAVNADATQSASLVTTAKAAALTAHGHLTNSKFASSEAFYLRAYELFTQKHGAGHFLTKAMLSRLNRVRKLNGNKAPATDTDAPGVSTPLDILTTPRHFQVTPPPTPAPGYFTSSSTGIDGCTGATSITTWEECAAAAVITNTSGKEGSGTSNGLTGVMTWATSVSESIYIPGCIEGDGGIAYFNNGGSYGANQRGHSICK